MLIVPKFGDVAHHIHTSFSIRKAEYTPQSVPAAYTCIVSTVMLIVKHQNTQPLKPLLHCVQCTAVVGGPDWRGALPISCHEDIALQHTGTDASL